jgi:hypothetical protein
VDVTENIWMTVTDITNKLVCPREI